ncbi:MAG TPA: neuroendocrine convertase 1, partial [Thermoanaerobaculia bacterium]|nr:neuroendocrine convertase 1 [Thermoanaerobaculia bacterium]
MRQGFLSYWRPAALLVAALAFASGPAGAQSPPRITASAARQIQAIQSIKTSRTVAQGKIESRLLMAVLKQNRDTRLSALPTFRYVTPDADGKIEVDIDARTTADVKPVVDKVQALGGEVRTFHIRYRAVRARVPLGAVEDLAAFDGVLKVHLARKPFTSAINVSQGDVAHRAVDARHFFGVTGAGVKICVLSTGVDSLAALQASGDLPPGVDVLPGQAGSGDEGSAMLEIVHDLAPGAQLGFATANPDVATFAANIIALKDAGCNIIADDVLYLVESPFQDLDIADAVNQVTAAGVLYFSSAGNEGNVGDGTAGHWEGNFVDSGIGVAKFAGTAHNFAGTTGTQIY